MTVLCLEIEQGTGWVTVPPSVLVYSLAWTRVWYTPGSISKGDSDAWEGKVNPIKVNFVMARGPF